MENIRLVTERLIIRNPNMDDLDNWHKLLSDGYNMRFLRDIRTQYKSESRKNLIDAISDICNPDRIRFFLAMETHDGDFIGSIGFTVLPSQERRVHMGYFLLPEHHGRGYATEGVLAILKFAFDDLGVEIVQTGANLENKASIRVMEKAGLCRVRQSTERVEYEVRVGAATGRP
ncbi:MAG: GNAT family N-acetyltransferase [Defluviitaleaceae bacterium]|nr:GNAT family N-acetyltransferase [Defluviitaleaceae bacterium]